MTAAYSAFANGGMRPTPYLVRRVETAEGQVLLSARPSGQRAVSEATAFLMTSMLQDVEAQRLTEIDVINGAIVREADLHDVPVPVNRAMVALVHGLERSWEQ